MKKSDRELIKNVVKECLIEILSEGILANNKTEENFSIKENSRKKRIRESKTSYLDKMSYEKKSQPAARKPSINTNLTNDSVLNSILADTAQSTLQAQIAAESRGHSSQMSSAGDAAARIVAESNPEDLFESSSKWSKLAFLND